GPGCFDVGIISGADRNREVQVPILEHQRTPSIPAFHYVGHALLAKVGNEKTTVEEDRVGPRVFVGAEERRQVARDGRIGNVGQAKLSKETALFLGWFFVDRTERQETIEREFQGLLAQNF